MNEIIDNKECEFRIDQPIKVISGLYVGYDGKFVREENKKYIIKIYINEKPQLLRCNPEQIQALEVKKFLGIFPVVMSGRFK